ncbi:MAG: DUF5597 domain-containing protein [Bacteroidota bacterium]
MKKHVLLNCLLFFVTMISAQDNSIPHLQKQGTATQLIVNNKPFLMLCGELHNSSTSDAPYMRPIWQVMADKNLNTVVAGVSWELIEKEKGKFDFTLVDSMITGARMHGLHLIVIWFASWKNSASTYMPSWVKRDTDKYPRVKDQSGKTLEILSTFGDASCEADAAAFKALMKHIRETDQQYQTVVMVQVENEVGILNSNRDYNAIANKAFANVIPKELSNYLSSNKEKLIPELSNVWKASGSKTNGSWEDVFGKSIVDEKDWKTFSYYTEELFMAWHYAKYIGRVVAAGKEEYPIPMFVNAWLKQPDTKWPGKYPSGGPLPQVMDMWRAAAPAIDMIVPDIYMPYFEWVCEQFHRNGNPLLIPETRGGNIGAARAFFVFGQYDAMCFSPFGIDGDYRVDSPLTEAYAVLGQLKDLILQQQGKGTMAGVLVDSLLPARNFDLGSYHIDAHLSTWPLKSSIAGGIVINIAPDEFIVAGKGLDILFSNTDKKDLSLIGIDIADEGTFKDGKWIAGRRLNGDEVNTSTWSGTGLKFSQTSYSIQHVKLYRYK